MSRSTPISNLPNIKNNQTESSNAYDETENELVQEILKEIDTEKKIQPQPQPQPPNVQNEEQYRVNEHMREQQMMHNQMLENANQEKTLESDSMITNIINMARQPIIVALIAIVISIPSITNILENFVKSKGSLASYSTMIILLVKGILAGGLYFGINKSM